MAKSPSRPIAGTARRGATRSEDEHLAEMLLADPKECAEHLMLLDLGRNDVGRVAKIGTIQVTEQFIIERYSHVMHIVSNVIGELDVDTHDAIDALMAGFPAGTVSGAPKVRAMEIIDELEKEKRGPLRRFALGTSRHAVTWTLALSFARRWSKTTSCMFRPAPGSSSTRSRKASNRNASTKLRRWSVPPKKRSDLPAAVSGTRAATAAHSADARSTCYTARMLKLTLLRHAKSSWDDPDLDDHERPLAPRGTKAALKMAEIIRDNDLVPDQIVCSDAVRNASHARPGFCHACHFRIRPLRSHQTFISCQPKAMLAALTAYAGEVRHAMLIGHNPGMHALALSLIGSGRRADIVAIAQKFPTAALAHYTFEVTRWDQIVPGTGHLAIYQTPRK